MLTNISLPQRKTTLAKPLFRIALLLFAFLILLIGLGSLFATPAAPVAADADFVEEFRGTGRYGFVADGVGTRGDPVTDTWTGSGTFTINIPATATVIKARLIWTGRSDAYDADGVRLERNGTDLGIMNDPNATDSTLLQYEQDPWCCNAQQRHESVDVTSLVLPGVNVFTVSDHEHGLSPTSSENLNYGVGMWVVYQDDSEPEGETVVYQGQDSFFRNWTPPRGPHTEVRCATFTADPTNRLVDVIHLVSGIDTYDLTNNTYRERSVAVWYESGSGNLPPAAETLDPGAVPPPPTMSSRATAEGVALNNQFPLQSYAGLEWDNFANNGNLSVSAGEDWACFQIESGDSTNLSGLMPPAPDPGPLQASGMWNLFAIRIRPVTPTAVTLTSFNARQQAALDVALTWSTEAEIDNFGFKLYRANTDQFAAAEEIHFEPSALSDGSGMGAAYEYVDSVAAFGDWWYWLEDIDTNGEKTLHGPVMVSVSRVHTLYVPVVLR